MTSERNAQVNAINHLIQNLNGVYRMAMQHPIKELPNILRKDELPERVMVVERGWNDESCLLVVTDSRIIFVTEKSGLSWTPKMRVEDFPCDKITSVEYQPGLAKHQIIFRVNGKKETFHLRWWDGKFEARQIAEYLLSKVHANAHVPDASLAKSGKVSVAKDDKTARAYAVEDAVRSLNDLDGSERTFEVGGELKRLPNILEDNELPERLMPASYDERHGLQVSKTTNRRGLLVATDRRLIFVDKDMGALKVDDFAYSKISHVEFSTGMLSGDITIHVSGSKEVFEGDFLRVPQLGKHLQEKIAPHAIEPTKSRPDVINEAILNLGHTQKALDSIGVGHLPEVLEDDELPEKMTFLTHEYRSGALLATASRLIFVPSQDMAPPVGNSSPEVKSFPYSNIVSVESSTGIFFGKIIIGLSGGKEVFDSLTNGNVREFEAYIRAKISPSTPSPATSNPSSMPPAAGHISVADELEKLHGLVVKGILTQEEFEAEKKRLLNG